MGLLTVEEVAEMVKIKPEIIRRWLRDGTLTGIKLGRVWRVDERDLEEFIRQAKNKQG